MLGMAPGAKEVVVPTANMSHLKETPGKAVANGAVAIDEAAGVAEETVTTGKDSSGLSCYAYCIYAFAYIRTKAAYLSLNPYLLSGRIVNPPGNAQAQEDEKQAHSQVLPSDATAVGTAVPAVHHRTCHALINADASVVLRSDAPPAGQPAVAEGEVPAAGKDPFPLVAPQTHMRIFACARMGVPREEKCVYGQAYPDSCVCIPIL